MKFNEFLKAYRDNRNMSVRAFAEILTVDKYRLAKWEKGVIPNFDDTQKILKYFCIEGFENFSEDLLKNFDTNQNGSSEKYDDVLRLKNQLLAEKDKRISNLEETIKLLKITLEECLKKVKEV